MAKTAPTLSLPQRLVADIGKKYPDVWRLADSIRQKLNDYPELRWPDEVFLPFNAWLDAHRLVGVSNIFDIDQIFDLQRIACAAAWRPGQDIVRFDPDIMAAIAETPLDDALPAGILRRLPAWAVYVETPGLKINGGVYDGFIARLDLRNPDADCLRLMFLSEEDEIEFILTLDAPTPKEAFLKSFEDMEKLVGVEVREKAEGYYEREGLQLVINLLLYLCSYGLTDNSKEISKPVYPKPKKVKTGWRLFPPDKPRIHTLGSEFGRQIRAGRDAVKAGSHAGPRPHIRRAHWHSYWIGPKGSQKILVHWLPPIPVAMAEDEKD